MTKYRDIDIPRLKDTSFGGHVIPNDHGRYDIGAESNKWRRIYAKVLKVERVEALFVDGEVPEHDVVGGSHSVTGSQYDIVGLTAGNTLGLLTPSSSPGPSQKILITNASGNIALTGLSATKVTTPEIEYSGNIAIDAISAAANTRVNITNSDATYKSYLSTDGGIYAGSLNDPGNGNIKATGNIVTLGGMRIGSDSTVYGNDLIVDGGIYVGGSSDPAVGTLVTADYIVGLGGIYSGSNTDPGTGNIKATGNITLVGGLHVGSDGTCYTGDIVIDGGIALGATVNPAAGDILSTGGISLGYTGADPGDGHLVYTGYLYPRRGTSNYAGRVLTDVQHQAASTSPTLTTSWQTVNSKAVTVPAGAYVVAFAHFSSVCTSFSTMQNINFYVYSSPALSGGSGAQYGDPTIGYAYDQGKVMLVFSGYYSTGGTVTIYQQQKKSNSSNTTTGHTETELTILIFT